MDFGNISNAFTKFSYAVTGKTEEQEEVLKNNFHIGDIKNTSFEVVSKEKIGDSYSKFNDAVDIARKHKGSEIVYRSNIDDKWHVESIKKVDKKGNETDIESKKDSIHGETEINHDSYNFSKKIPVSLHYSFVDDDNKTLKENTIENYINYPNVDFSTSNYFYDVIRDIIEIKNTTANKNTVEDMSKIKSEYSKKYNMTEEQFKKAEKISDKLLENIDLLEKFDLMKYVDDKDLLTPKEKKSGKTEFNRMKFLLELSGDTYNKNLHSDSRYLYP